MINLSSFVASHAVRAPDHCAISYEGREISYARLADGSARLATKLTELGIGQGDVVALLMKNSPAYIQLAMAISHMGSVFLPINFRLSREEVAYILEDSGARLLFVDEEFADKSPGQITTIQLGNAEQGDASSLGEGCAPMPAAARGTQDLMRLMYTSGTTARPKGVMHSYENFYFKSIDHLIALGLNQDTRLLVCGPLYHVGAFDLPGVAVLWAGGMLSILRDFHAEKVLATIEAQRLTGAWLAPVMTSELLSLELARDYDLDSLDWVIAGGERTPEERIHEFSRLFRRARYVDAYGLTESCSGDTLMEKGFEFSKIGSTGRALMHVEIAIKDDAGEPVTGGGEGEICLKGPKVTKGYWNDAAKTRESFFGEWFRTGDVGYLDHDGFLFITDRKKDMIISGGENIASLEVERVIGRIDEVADVAVIGRKDDRWGEVPVAFVVLHPGATMDLDALDRHCRSFLAPYKVPKALYVLPTLPRNPSGKILKVELRKKLESEWQRS